MIRSRTSSFAAITALLLGLILIVTLYYNAPSPQKWSEGWAPAKVLDWDDGQVSQGQGQGQLDQEDKRLVDYVVQSGWILPPPPPNTNYHLSHPEVLDPSMGQSKVVLRVLNNMTGGFFVECGALDGETRSNTLYMERVLGWRGLLVEAGPSNFKLLQAKGRKAYSVNVCLATQPTPHVVMFQQQFNVGKITNVDPESVNVNEKASNSGNLVRIQCLPLHTLLLALNVTTVDYFSLDVEGAEFDVLRTIPFDQIRIRVLSVEYIHDKVPPAEIVAYMSTFGYIVEAKVNHVNGLANDYIFVHQSVYYTHCKLCKHVNCQAKHLYLCRY